ncbi:hypothetical protein H9Y05_06210 [Crocinitomicaceae bacterium CZZ-1]|uniref:Uncharacterized protein n=1 Tax=Taishania pollutisoli TaxID=2766479 RepID=A0A8J6U241_9FLAO|nr:hypothetical protein [Taishania pollutisoli]MBC9812070.1 hypothetical protein [Taishania pollutisoli]NGF74773.1 hypothetical protein [Fluviicola sp. SGL-29]
MKYCMRLFTIAALGVLIFSCNKREIIPAPEPKVDLKNHFYAKINGSDLELTQNVNGFSGTSGVDLIINASTLDSAVYHSIFESTQTSQKVNIGHGSIVFDWNASERPTLNAFESFYTSGLNQTPVFSTNGLSGFVFTYTDGAGREWKSGTLGNVAYSSMAIESDSSGDYAKFKVNFDTEVSYTYYDPVLQVNVTNTMTVTDAVYTGWYKR